MRSVADVEHCAVRNTAQHRDRIVCLQLQCLTEVSEVSHHQEAFPQELRR